jgi:hypothetical protein
MADEKLLYLITDEKATTDVMLSRLEGEIAARRSQRLSPI